MRRTIIVGAILCSAAAGCEDPVVVGPGPALGAPGTTSLVTPAAPAAAGAANAETDAGPDDGPKYDDEDFVEIDLKHRDPFRAFNVASSDADSPAVVTRYVKLPEIAIDEMRLIAIVTNAPKPYAMVIDRTNVGTVIEVRDYIGRAEVVQTGGSDSMPIQLNWRVDRIRDGEVVLAREDPTAPNQPPVFRTIQLHPEGQAASSRGVVTSDTRRAVDPTANLGGPSGAGASGGQGYRLTLTAPTPSQPEP